MNYIIYVDYMQQHDIHVNYTLFLYLSLYIHAHTHSHTHANTHTHIIVEFIENKTRTFVRQV